MQVEHMIKPEKNAPIGWLGGKTRLRATIINSFPIHRAYIEVFAGSATVFFGKPPLFFSKPVEGSPIEVINDINEDLVTLMKVLSGTCFDEEVRQEFIGYVRDMPAARAVFEDWKHWDEDRLSKLNPAQRAFRFYYCIKKGFSSMITGGYEASPFTSSRYNQSADFDYIKERFRITDAQIERLDFRDLVDKWNRQGGEAFFFCDPPYFVADDTNYYEYTFNKKDHLDFKGKMDEIQINGNKFLITYDDVPEVLDLYASYFIYRTDPITYRAADERGSRNIAKSELFITNYNICDAIRDREKKTNRGRRDLFAESNEDDSVIQFPDSYNLTLINRPR